MRVTTIVIAVLCFTAIAFGFKNKDLVGNWSGVANIPEDPPRIEFTLNFTLEDGQLKGVVNDDMGFVDNAPLQDIKIEQNKFSCLVVTTDYMAYRVKLSGTYDAKTKTLSGKLEVPAEGVEGTWKATKVEKKTK